jgi:hypothetical protein
MLSRMIKITTTILLQTLLLTTLGCKGSSSDGESWLAMSKTKIDLMDVKNGRCLDVGKLNAAARNMSVPARRIITNVDFRPFKGHTLSRNYSVRVAYGIMNSNSGIMDKPLNEMEEFREATQTNCESVLVSDPAGGDLYKVTKATSDSLTMVNTWDEQMTYEWISNNEVRVTQSFVMPDNCVDKKKVRVIVESTIIWGSDIYTETISAKSINSQFLDLVADATGYNRSSIYEADGPISVSKLRAMAEAKARPEILLCY